jgi:hypothetical protein
MDILHALNAAMDLRCGVLQLGKEEVSLWHDVISFTWKEAITQSGSHGGTDGRTSGGGG